MTYCANCGAKLEGNESFCPYCGQLFKKREEVNITSPTSKIEALQHEVSYLKEQLNAQKVRDKPTFIPQKKQESDCWKYCCIVVLLMMIFGIFPWFIIF